MADSGGMEDGKVPAGSQTADAGNAGLARGTAGKTTGVQDDGHPAPREDMEERRETEQVKRPSTDGMGEGLQKDRS